MKFNQLGKTDLLLSPIGLGTFPLGGEGWPYAWGPQDDKASVRTIHKALDLGVNWIDTAPVYGFGHAEEIVRRAIKDMKSRPIIATKCSLIWNDQIQVTSNLSKQSVISEAEASLKRLQIDVIDLYQIHWPNPKHQIEEAWEAMSQLQKDGKIRYPAVSNFSIQQMERLQSINLIASLQPPYSMVKRHVEDEVLPFCEKNKIGVIPYSPIQKGLLSGKMTVERALQFPETDHRKRDPDFQEPWLSVHLDLISKLKVIADKFNKTVAQLAIAWVLSHPAVTSVIVGARHPGQIEETIHASEWELSSEIKREIQILLVEHQKKLRSL